MLCEVESSRSFLTVDGPSPASAIGGALNSQSSAYIVKSSALDYIKPYNYIIEKDLKMVHLLGVSVSNRMAL
jgi:hypothetical protein